jgi:hypothetical protein
MNSVAMADGGDDGGSLADREKKSEESSEPLKTTLR